MSNTAKNNLWKAVGKQSPNYHITQSHQESQEKPKETHQINNSKNKSSQCNKPPPLLINNNLTQKYSATRAASSHKHQHVGSSTPSNRQKFLTVSHTHKSRQQQQNLFQRCSDIVQIQQPGSPWINDQGDKISHIVKRSYMDEQLSFSIEKGIEEARPQFHLSVIHENNKAKSINSPSGNGIDKGQSMYFTRSVPYLRETSMIQDYQVQQNKQGQASQTKGCRKQQLARGGHWQRQISLVEQINQLKHALALQKISHTVKQKDHQNQIKDLTLLIDRKASLLHKINLKFKPLVHKIQQLQIILHQQLKVVPQQLKHFSNQELLKTHSQIIDRLIQFGYGTRQWSQDCLEEEYQKRKIVERECQEIKKRAVEQENIIHGLQQDKSKLQKLIRDLQFTVASSHALQQEMQTRIKKFSQQKSQLNIEIQNLSQRNKSLKEHISSLTKNVYSKSSKEGDEQEELTRRCKRMRKELEEKESQVQQFRSQLERLRQEQENKLQTVNMEMHEVENKMVQYKNRLRQQTQIVEQKLRDQQLTHQSTKQSLQTVQLKLKENELFHYKQIQAYDQALREVEKDLEILSLKKNLKEEQLGQKELELGKRENELISLQEDLRQQKNELQCAKELYQQNLLLLQKKEGLLTSQYHETLALQTQSKAAWYERYYKLYSPSCVSNTHSHEKGFLTTNKFINSGLSAKNNQKNELNTERILFVDAPYLNDVKRMAIKERLTQIDGLKSRVKLLSPRHARKSNQILSKPQSPRAVHLVYKAKSLQSQRISMKSPWRERPQRDKNPKTHEVVSLSIAQSQSPKQGRINVDKEFSVVRAKLDQIKSSIHDEINAWSRE